MTSESSVAGHTPGPWIFDGDCEIVEEARPHMRVCFLPSDHAEYASSKPNGYLIAAAPEMFQALREWKCPGCGGSGKYEQDKAGRARNAERGRMNDPRHQPEPVTCKVCDGTGLHPIARAALARAHGGEIKSSDGGDLSSLPSGESDSVVTQDYPPSEATQPEPEAVTPNERFMPRMLVLGDMHAVCVGGRWDGWQFYKHPDGQWVSLKKLKEERLPPSSPAST